jgi:hypothetical protein
MQIRGDISIQAVIDDMRSTDRKGPFVLQFVVSSGKHKGRLKTVRALYGRSTREKTSIDPRHKAKTLHKDDGTLPMQDVDIQQYITPLISHFRVYNGYFITH